MKKFFNKLIHHVSSLFKNGGEHWSSTRFAFLLSVVISNFILFGAWLSLSLSQGTLLPIDSSLLLLYGLANGISSTTKLVQKSQEKK